MYSSSNSFLGGANSARPGQQQSSFGQQSGFSQFPQGQQQPSLGHQSTVFPGGQLQSNFTGFPGATPPQQGFSNFGQQAQQQPPHLQSQFTGFHAPNQQPQPPQPPSEVQRFPMSTGAPSIAVHKTSSQIAQSFQDIDGAPRPQPPQP